LAPLSEAASNALSLQTRVALASLPSSSIVGWLLFLCSSHRAPPPLPSYPTPITAIACPSIGDGIKIVLEITIGGDESPKKNERAGVRSHELVADQPLTDWWFDGRGGELGRRNGSDIVVVLLLLHIKTHILSQFWPGLLTFAPTLIKTLAARGLEELFFLMWFCVSFWFWREIGFGFTYLCT
jgi:hypothetical protein